MVTKSMMLILVAAFLAAQVQGAVLGVDFGSEYYKISVISRNKPSYDMVENMNSKTNTYSVVAFHDNTRFFEYEAYQKTTKEPQNTFYLFNKFIGIDSNDEKWSQAADLHFDDYKRVEIDGETFFELKNFVLPFEGENKAPSKRLEGKTLLRLEEVVGMILEHGKNLCDKYVGEEIKGVYFSVPAWWTPTERQVLLSSAKLGGFTVSGFASENTGTAAYHAANRPKGAKPETILFLNMGTQSLELSLFKFENVTDDKKKTRESVRLLGESWEESNGGYSIDRCIALDFAKSFDEKFKMDSILVNKRVMRRLIKESTKTKEVLSANKEHLMIVEEVHGGIDFSKKYIREDLDKLCGSNFEKVEKAIDRVLEQAGLTKDDIDSIELLGGASRIPKVHQLIKEKLGKSHSIHFNGDNSMAQGLAFIAGNTSNLIRSKDIVLSHGPSYDVTVEIDDPSSEGENKYHKESVIFKRYSSYGSKKLVNLNYGKDVDITLKVVASKDESHTWKPYWVKYRVSGVESAMAKLNYDNYSNKKVALHFELDHTGIPHLHKAELTADETSSSGSKKTAYEKVKLALVGESTVAYHEDDKKFQESKEILAAFREYDERIKRLKEAKNKLESIVYKAKYMEEDDLVQKYAAESEVAAIKKQAAAIEEWLFTPEAKKATWEVLQEKSKPFNDFQEKSTWRRDQHINRLDEMKKFNEKIDTIERAIRAVSQTRSWVPESERQAGIKTIQSIRSFMEEKVQEQASMKTNLDPILTLELIKEKAAEASEELTRLRAIPKNPSSTDEKKDAPKTEDKKAENSEGSSNGKPELTPRLFLNVKVV